MAKEIDYDIPKKNFIAKYNEVEKYLKKSILTKFILIMDHWYKI